MSHRTRKILVGVSLYSGLILVVAVVISARHRLVNRIIEPSPTSQNPAANNHNGPRARNLALQPEAFNMSRRLGRRFATDGRDVSVASGALTVGSQRQAVQISRSQTSDGEEVEITRGAGERLAWDAGKGSSANNRRANEADRELIERLVADGPDQFILAQLRGASYYTVGGNLRPDDAANNYNGPTWTVIRVTNSESDESKRPLNQWRLYYINTRTGLIDRIISNSQGQETIAELSWTNTGGETVPARIVWKRQGQVLMRFDLGGFSHADRKGANR